MNIANMHIGIDVELREINSTLFDKIQHEEKDYVLNRVIEELLLAVINEEENTVFNAISYEDIRKFYSVLQTHIRTEEVGKSQTAGEKYVEADLPSDITIESIKSGLLYKGVKYKCITPGATNLTAFGGGNPSAVNSEFTCTISNLTGTSINFIEGEKYRILNPGQGSTFAAVGAPDANPGTVFTATVTSSVTGLTKAATFEHLSDTPSWDGITTLVPRYNPGYFNILNFYVNVDYGAYISSGTLTPNKKYRVVTAGLTDFSGVGGYNAWLAEDVVFTCNSSNSISWDSDTQLVETKDVPCRIVRANDIHTTLDHKFGTTITSPIAIIANDKLRIYHDNKFDINRIYIDYIRKPVEVNYTDSIDCDLHSSVHGLVVSLAARKLAASMGTQQYQNLAIESEQTKKKLTE